jgi:hypothetical protein
LSSSSRAKLPPTLGRCIPSGAAPLPPHHPFHRIPHFIALRISSHFASSSHHFTVFSIIHPLSRLFMLAGGDHSSYISCTHPITQILRKLEFIHQIHHPSCLMLCMRGNVTAESCTLIFIHQHFGIRPEGPGRDNNADRADDSERTFSNALIIHHI